MSSQQQEEWRPVVGYEGQYVVSSEGRVRSLDRVNGYGRRLRGRPMSLVRHPRGYMQLTLTQGGVCETKKVHRLVLEAFSGPCPDGMEGCHINGIRHDNRPENLRWDTPKENAADRKRIGTQVGANKTHCKRGHELVEPNLVRWHVEHTGRRLCLACNKAHQAKRRGKFNETYADECYAEIMGGAE